MEINAGFQVQLELDAGAGRRFKTRSLDGDRVLAWIEQRERVVTGAGRRVLPLDPGSRLEKRDLCTYKDCAARICDGSQNSGLAGLGKQS
jgi:hypothetical protein